MQRDQGIAFQLTFPMECDQVTRCNQKFPNGIRPVISGAQDQEQGREWGAVQCAGGTLPAITGRRAVVLSFWVLSLSPSLSAMFSWTAKLSALFARSLARSQETYRFPN